MEMLRPGEERCVECGGPCRFAAVLGPKLEVDKHDYTLKLADCEVKPKMEPRKSDRDLILKEEFDDKVDKLFYILKDRQRCLYEAKEALTGNTVELHQADTSRDYGKLGCKIMLTREELLAGVNRRVNFAEDEAQIVVRELHATLGSLIADLKYRPPIEAEQWNP